MSPWIIAGLAVAASILLSWITYEIIFRKRK
jgi:hypothetical protein